MPDPPPRSGTARSTANRARRPLCVIVVTALIAAGVSLSAAGPASAGQNIAQTYAETQPLQQTSQEQQPSKTSASTAHTGAGATAQSNSSVTLLAGPVTNNTATLTISGHTAAWWYKQTSPTAGTCASVAANTATASLAGLTAARTHAFKAYDAAGCGSSDEIASEVFRTPTDGEYFAYEIPHLVLRAGEAFSFGFPAYQCANLSRCGNAYSIASSPGLPSGLSFNASTRVLSGTPTSASPATTHTYQAVDQNIYTTTAQQFEITVLAAQDLSLSRSRLALTEGSDAAYTVKLPTAPTGAVTVTVASADTAAVSVDTDASTPGDQSTLTFTASDYSTAQTVSLTAIGDTDGANESVAVTHSASGGGYDDKSASLTAVAIDDDRGLAVSAAEPLRLNKRGSARDRHSGADSPARRHRHDQRGGQYP